MHLDGAATTAAFRKVPVYQPQSLSWSHSGVRRIFLEHLFLEIDDERTRVVHTTTYNVFLSQCVERPVGVSTWGSAPRELVVRGGRLQRDLEAPVDR